MKFKLDENIPWILKKVIESRGDHQVDSVYHENLSGIPDIELLIQCKKEQRILITLDQDFENNILHEKGTYYGIIILKQKTQGKQAVKDLFEKFLDRIQLVDVIMKKFIVEPKIIKIVD